MASHVPDDILDGVKIIQLKTGFDQASITADENSFSVLKYRTPKFRAVATVDIPPLAANERIEVGWIQVCTSLLFANEYGQSGMTSWELPELVSGFYNMVSDTDGKRYPWYGARHEVVSVQGPLPLSTLITVNMLDHFRPQVTWYIPTSADERGTKCRQARLTSVHRHQCFLTFLAIRYANATDSSNESDIWSNVHVLKSISWSIDVQITVDPSRPYGRRVTSIGPVKQSDPTILEADESPRLEKNALHPPNANSAQTLVWWPAEPLQRPSIVISPLMTLISLAEAKRTYLNARGERAAMLRNRRHRIGQGTDSNC